MAKEIFDRVPNLTSPISRRHSERKSPIEQNSLCTLAGNRTFCLLIGGECIYAILASSNGGMSTRRFLQPEKWAPGRSGASRSEN
ncbi:MULTISPECIES: hypothetical protein [unclassified Microcoleus]|uniref:hypothetical protein n=1 Tax=unclassified Microcoleus TaxID=2642155 RepID=UPI002FD4608B